MKDHLGRWVVLAAALHLALPAVLLRVARRSVQAPPAPAASLLTIELSEPEPRSEAPSFAKEPTPGEPSVSMGAAGRAVALVRQPVGAASDQPGASSNEPQAGPDVQASPEQGWSLSPLRGASGQRSSSPGPSSSVSLGLEPGMRWSWMRPSSAAEQPAPRADNEAGGLRQVLRERDQAMGLGQGGAVVSAVHAAAAGIAAPRSGVALFEARFDASGLVQSVDVHAVQGDSDSWQVAARQALAQLRSRKIQLPQGTRSAVIVVRVEAKETLPSGSKSARPRVTGLARGVGVGLGGEFDAADIGAKPTHLVSVRVVEERYL